jgi:hypothetical protein
MDLRPHQLAAAYDLFTRVSRDGWAYLAGEVRVGKTLTVLEVAQRLGVTRCLFLTKKKAIASIEADRDALDLTDRAQVTNYEQVHKLTGQYDLLILDEAHCLGAYPKASLRARQVAGGLTYDRCILLSGTPSPESLSQLYHQIRIASAAGLSTAVPWQQPSFYKWAAAGYVNVRTKRVGTGQEVNDYSDANEALIMADLAPHMVRITQQQAGFQTQIIEQVHQVRMAPQTYADTGKLMRDDVVTVGMGWPVVADTAAKQMQKLRQMYSGTVIPEGAAEGVILDTSKVDYIRNRFRWRLAILYCFQAEGVMLRQAYGPLATDSPEEFAARPDSVFIGQVQASREGVNLSPADDLVFLGIDYSALSYLQGRDRASALGRTVPPRVHWILAANSLELKVYDKVRAKESYTAAHFRADRGSLSGKVG